MPSPDTGIGLITHPVCHQHANGPGHPESPLRLDAVRARLEQDIVARGAGQWITAPVAADADILLAHTAHHLERLRRVDSAGGGWLDPDTAMNRSSLEAALRAAGAAVLAAERALRREGTSFCATRPPGHHATPSRAMGFCLLSSAAIAAHAAIARLGADRVLVVDWDVHHGNGTADCVREEPRIRYVSMHQWPYYPGTGSADDTGCGNLFHVPRGPGLPPGVYVRDLLDAVAKATTGFAPSLVIHSAGFDCLAGDPLGGFTLEPEHLVEITHGIDERAGRAPAMSVMEGGYAPDRVAEGAVRHALALARAKA